MSAQGLRQGEDGPEKIADKNELAEIRVRGRRALALSVITTFATTAPFLLT